MKDDKVSIQALVLDVLMDGPATVHQIADATGLSAKSVSYALQRLRYLHKVETINPGNGNEGGVYAATIERRSESHNPFPRIGVWGL